MFGWTQSPIREDFEFLWKLIEAGGPDAGQYADLNATFGRLRQHRDEYSDVFRELRVQSGRAFNSVETMQGHVCLRPHGYFGDFEIIDRIYSHYASNDPLLSRWDTFFHAGTAAVAVRNRKTFFLHLLGRDRGRIKSLLNIASGPCRDLKEAYERDLLSSVGEVVCLDSDPVAVAYAQNVLVGCAGSPQFVTRNALRYRDERRFSLVWSAGLFDYLADSVAVLLLRRLVGMCAPGGKVVVGNFSNENTQRFYMEFGGWDLIYRDQKDLLRLAGAAGLPPSRLHVEAEPTGVNLFLTIEC